MLSQPLGGIAALTAGFALGLIASAIVRSDHFATLADFAGPVISTDVAYPVVPGSSISWADK
jgi:hypothetical protein